MRSHAAFGLLAGLALTTVRVTSQTVVDNTAVSGLSSCVLRCTNTVFLTYDCLPSQQCFCDNAQVQDSMAECLQMNGCSFSDHLAASRFRASACDAPRRNRGPTLSIVAYVLFGVAAACTLARLASRWSTFGGPGYGWDDGMAFICLTALTVFTVSEYYAVKYGKGRDIWTLDVLQIMRFHMWFYIASIMYVFVIFGTKISLVLLYLRNWRAKSSFRTLCLLTLTLLGAALVAFVVTTIAQCRPITSQWNRFESSGSEGTCVDRQALLWALAATSIGFDVLVVLLPIRHLVKLNISWAKRTGICSVFLVGFAVTAMSIVRLFYIHDFTTTFNSTYYYSFIGLYSSIEAYLSQVCCCMPGTAGFAVRAWTSVTSDFSSLASKKSSHETMRISAPLQVPERHDFAAAIHTPRNVPDLEKADHPGSAVVDYVSDDESAPPPVVQRSSHNSQALKHQSSFEPIIERIEQQRATYRSSATTATRNLAYRDSGTDARTPDILYHDRQNQLRLEIHDPPDKPLKAQLQYVDKNDGVHDLELQGRPREPSTRPNTAPSPAGYSSTSSSSSISTDLSDAGAPVTAPHLNILRPALLPWSHQLKGRPSMQGRSRSQDAQLADLANAHKILTEEGMSSNHTLSTV